MRRSVTAGAFCLSLAATLAVSGCGSSAEEATPAPTAGVAPQPVRASEPAPTAAAEEEGSRLEASAFIINAETGLPAGGPKFQAHFADPIYADPSDDFAPFGSTQGFELVTTWAGRADELSTATTVAEIAGQSPQELLSDPTDRDALTLLYSAAFTVLALTDQIDKAGHDAALSAIDAMQSAAGFPEPSLIFAREDLESWSS